MLHIAVHALHKHAAMAHIDDHHEDQCHENTASGAQGTSHRSVDRLGRFALSHDSLHQEIGRQNTDHRIRDLLQDLGDRRLQHGLVRLEVAAQDAQYSEQEYGRGKNLQDRHTVGRHQRSRAKIEKHTSHNTHEQRVDHGTVEHLLGVSVVSHRHFLGHLLGDRRRDAEAGDHQHNCIDIDRRSVIAVSFIADDRRQGSPVQQSDDSGQYTGCRQNSGLGHDIAASERSGFFVFI